jgi:hypothetical protein
MLKEAKAQKAAERIEDELRDYRDKQLSDALGDGQRLAKRRGRGSKGSKRPKPSLRTLRGAV